jgi:hypothetical protein
MTAPHARPPQILARPACTPAAIRAVLAANADADVLRRYDDELDAAFERAREHGDLTPLLEQTPGAIPMPSESSWPASSATRPKGLHPPQSALAGRRSAPSTAFEACTGGTTTTLHGSTSPP